MILEQVCKRSRRRCSALRYLFHDAALICLRDPSERLPAFPSARCSSACVHPRHEFDSCGCSFACETNINVIYHDNRHRHRCQHDGGGDDDDDDGDGDDDGDDHDYEDNEDDYAGDVMIMIMMVMMVMMMMIMKMMMMMMVVVML
jgi:hypothetical protein